MSSFSIKPQTFVVTYKEQNYEWTTEAIVDLRRTFSGRPYLEATKMELRRSSLFQFAFKSGVVLIPKAQAGDKATVHLTKLGLDLIGAV